MRAKPAPDRIVSQIDPDPPEGYAPAACGAESDKAKPSRFTARQLSITAPCPECGALMEYYAISRHFVCIRPSCGRSYHLRSIEAPTVSTHCRRCGHIMMLRSEDAVFLCSNPRCPVQIGLRALLNDLRVVAEQEHGPDSVPASQRGVVYMLHYHTPIGARRVRHYTGWCKYLPARIAAHLQGKGSALTRAFFRLGISFEIGFTTPGSPAFERKLKRQRHAARYCIACQRENDPAMIARLNEIDELL